MTEKAYKKKFYERDPKTGKIGIKEIWILITRDGYYRRIQNGDSESFVEGNKVAVKNITSGEVCDVVPILVDGKMVDSSYIVQFDEETGTWNNIIMNSDLLQRLMSPPSIEWPCC